MVVNILPQPRYQPLLDAVNENPLKRILQGITGRTSANHMNVMSSLLHLGGNLMCANAIGSRLRVIEIRHEYNPHYIASSSRLLSPNDMIYDPRIALHNSRNLIRNIAICIIIHGGAHTIVLMQLTRQIDRLRNFLL